MSILGAKTDNSNIGNYASLDPAAGSFTFKGSLPVGKDSSPHLSYLSIAVGGDLISDSYAALFTNSKVNTNATVEAQWHVRLGQNRFIIDQAQVGQYAVNKSLQQTRLFAAIAKINSTKQSTEIARDLYDRQLKKK
jgi:hypothetical protein